MPAALKCRFSTVGSVTMDEELHFVWRSAHAARKFVIRFHHIAATQHQSARSALILFIISGCSAAGGASGTPGGALMESAAHHSHHTHMRTVAAKYWLSAEPSGSLTKRAITSRRLITPTGRASSSTTTSRCTLARVSFLTMASSVSPRLHVCSDRPCDVHVCSASPWCGQGGWMCQRVCLDVEVGIADGAAHGAELDWVQDHLAQVMRADDAGQSSLPVHHRHAAHTLQHISGHAGTACSTFSSILRNASAKC